MRQCKICKSKKHIEQFYQVNNNRMKQCKACVRNIRKQAYDKRKIGSCCPSCGSNKLSDSKQCRKCFLSSIRITNYCIDCNTQISNHATRCKPCQNIRHGKKMSKPIGHKRIASNGYVMIKIKNNGKHRDQSEHRLVIEQSINRKLGKNEHVHHIDGNKTNNHLSNLMLITSADHNKINHFLNLLNNSSTEKQEKIILTIKLRFPNLFN